MDLYGELKRLKWNKVFTTVTSTYDKNCQVWVQLRAAYRWTHSPGRMACLTLAATWHWPTFIRQTARTHLMTVSWWEHHKHCLKYYYYLVQQYFITKLSSGWHCLIAQLTKSFLASLQLDYMTYQTVWSLLVTNVSTLGRPLLLQYLTPYPFTGDSWQMWN